MKCYSVACKNVATHNCVINGWFIPLCKDCLNKFTSGDITINVPPMEDRKENNNDTRTV